MAATVLLWAGRTITADADFRPVVGAERRNLLADVTVRINEMRCGLVTTSGTAVALNDGTLVTNRHVLDGALGLIVVPREGMTTTGAGSVSPTDDVAVLRVAGRAAPTGLELAARDPSPGAIVTVAGYPHGDDALVTAEAQVVDRVDGTDRGEPGPVLRLDYRAGPGMSGGPVLDAAGRLAGLLYAVEDNTGYTLVIPSSTIARVLAAGDLRPATRC